MRAQNYLPRTPRLKLIVLFTLILMLLDSKRENMGIRDRKLVNTQRIQSALLLYLFSMQSFPSLFIQLSTIVFPTHARITEVWRIWDFKIRGKVTRTVKYGWWPGVTC
jgi:hypothetical protein